MPPTDTPSAIDVHNVTPVLVVCPHACASRAPDTDNKGNFIAQFVVRNSTEGLPPIVDQMLVDEKSLS